MNKKNIPSQINCTSAVDSVEMENTYHTHSMNERKDCQTLTNKVCVKNNTNYIKGKDINANTSIDVLYMYELTSK